MAKTEVEGKACHGCFLEAVLLCGEREGDDEDGGTLTRRAETFLTPPDLLSSSLPSRLIVSPHQPALINSQL
ncbi:hypothetical protein AAFF_G00136760 [Aldrovandia affinis]|uniref:Uncharacterized protein n=1 Tax=Aldrovandia affinis TaxID=143900 RepID=A0AAD7TC73_9TELE|nr:hypothetical protein AAFF_G00136760 [Aldrovandia affinis]